MPSTYSPLRYPGGKTKYTKMLTSILEDNCLDKSTFVEVFAGGAGAAIALLLTNKVKAIFLNDFDPAIFSFWDSIVNHSEEFIKIMHETPVSITEWKKQRFIYRTERTDKMKLGFATFYLNRCNRAGILAANPIGGIKQAGEYKIDARFNKETSERKIRAIAAKKTQISLFNLDAVEFIKHLKRKHRNRKFLIYFDPPYYQKGQLLYLNHYQKDDHTQLRNQIVNCPFPWILSYDKQDEIVDLYKDYSVPIYQKNLQYSVSKPSMGEELIISGLKLPKDLQLINA